MEIEICGFVSPDFLDSDQLRCAIFFSLGGGETSKSGKLRGVSKEPRPFRSEAVQVLIPETRGNRKEWSGCGFKKIWIGFKHDRRRKVKKMNSCLNGRLHLHNLQRKFRHDLDHGHSPRILILIIVGGSNPVNYYNFGGSNVRLNRTA